MIPNWQKDAAFDSVIEDADDNLELEMDLCIQNDRRNIRITCKELHLLLKKAFEAGFETANSEPL